MVVVISQEFTHGPRYRHDDPVGMVWGYFLFCFGFMQEKIRDRGTGNKHNCNEQKIA
jgi:hypothetical protein